jgi:hypothetical protein
VLTASMTAVVHEAHTKSRLNFVNWYLYGDHDEEIDTKVSLCLTVDLRFDFLDTSNLRVKRFSY